jgi:hypothetical protein
MEAVDMQGVHICTCCGKPMEPSGPFKEIDVEGATIEEPTWLCNNPQCECSSTYVIDDDDPTIERDKTCPECNGRGIQWDGPEYCPHCDGEGYEWWT